MIPDPRDPGLVSMLPAFRRARSYRLYDGTGRRYLDLWQGHGSSILGHRVPGVSTIMKNAISRGLMADLPAAGAQRLRREIVSILPSHPHVRFYGSLDGCLAALSSWSGRPVGVADIHDPAGAGDEPPAMEIAAWRPFVPAARWERARALLPVLPFSLGGCPWAICFREEPGSLQSDVLSELLLAAAARSLTQLGRYSPGPAGPALARLESSRWRADGVYVTPSFDRARYPAVFGAFLSGGVVLSPRFDCPSILPAELSEGELAALVGLFRSHPLE